MSKTSIGSSAYILTADATGLSDGLKEANKEINGFTGRAGRAFSAFQGKITSMPGMVAVGAGAAVAAAGVATVAAGKYFYDQLTEGIERFEAKAIETSKAAKVLGDSTEGLSRVAYAVGGIDAAKEAMQELGETIGAAIGGDKAAIDLFSGLGTSAEELADLRIDERLIRIVKAMEGLSSFERLDVGKKLFKRYADDILPLINEGADGVRGRFARGMDLGLIVDNQSAKAAMSFGRSKKRMLESWNGMWEQMAPGIMRGLEPVSKELEKFVEPYFKKTGKVYERLGDLFAGTLPVLKTHLGKIFEYFQGKLDSVNPENYATNWAKMVAGVFATTVEIAMKTAGGIIKIVSMIQWAIDKIEWVMIQVGKLNKVSEVFTGRNDSDDMIRRLREHRARNRERIDDMNNMAQNAWDFDGTKFKNDLIDAIDKTNEAIENAEPPIDDAKRIDWTAKAIARFNTEAKAMKESIESANISATGNQVADKIEALANRFNKVTDTIAGDILELQRMGAQSSLKQVSRELGEQYDAIGKSAVDQKIDKINRAFGEGAEQIEQYANDLRSFAYELESIQRGFNLANVESPIEKMAKDYYGLMAAFKEGKITEAQLNLAAAKLVPDSTLSDTKPIPQALTKNSLDAYRADIDHRFGLSDRGGTPEEKIERAIKEQQEIQKRQLEIGRKSLEQLRKLEAAGTI